jgi:hypothetical protein
MEQLIQKRREFNLPTYKLFIDCEMVFDRVPEGKLWNIMKNKEFRDHTVKTVQNVHINTRIKTNKGTSVGNKKIHTVMCMVVRVTRMMGSSLNDWIY